MEVAKAIVHAYHQYFHVQRKLQREWEEMEKQREKEEKRSSKNKKRRLSQVMREKKVGDKLTSKADRSLWKEEHAKVLTAFEESLDAVIHDFIENHNGTINILHSSLINYLSIRRRGSRIYEAIESQSEGLRYGKPLHAQNVQRGNG